MIRQRKPTKRADQTVLAAFVLRQVFGIGVFGVVTYFALQVPDRRLAWVLIPFLALYLGYSAFVVVKALGKYRQRYGGKA